MKRWALTAIVGLLSGVAFAQAVGERVGIPAAGNNRPLYAAPCSPTTVGNLPAGIDGIVQGASQFCGGQMWLPTQWSNGLHGWLAVSNTSSDAPIPLAGQGVFPNVQAPLAYPVQVSPNASALNVRTGPGTQYSILTSKPAGSTGWAFEVFNNTATNTVWWRICWDDGTVGWSAEGVRGAGIYLTRVGAPRLKQTLVVQVVGASSVPLRISPTDLNHGAAEVNAPTTLIYLAGQSATLSAPEVAPNGATFSGWIVNGTPYRQRTLTLRTLSSLRLVLLYSPSIPASEAEFLRNLVAPWARGQVWLPSTYDSHANNNPLYAVDFNRVSSARATCPFQNGFLQDCNEPIVASHWGRAFTRAQSGCAGYGNYVVVVSNVRQRNTTNTYLATLYAHLNYFLVPNGTLVEAGTPIGRLGSTGSSTGPHLHYEVRYVTVSGSTLTLGARVQVLNNPQVRLSGQSLQVDFNCRVSGLGYAGTAIVGTAPLPSLPLNIEPPCAPYSCSGALHAEPTPSSEASRCTGELPETLVLYLSDVDGDGCVNQADLLRVLFHFGQTHTGAEDITWDGVVDTTDLMLVLLDFAQGCSE